MKLESILVCAVALFIPLQSSAAMSRVVAVADSRTVIITTKGATSIVKLRDVETSATDEPAAFEFLRATLADRWVYVENGDVYRSPDGLFVNDALRKRVWLGFTYLGQVNPAPASARERAAKKPSVDRPQPKKEKTVRPAPSKRSRTKPAGRPGRRRRRE